jgi:hypothetical protein
MDTNHDLFYWVTGTTTVRGVKDGYLCGLPFDETQTGVGGRDAEILKRPLWVVSSEDVSKFNGSVHLVHVNSAGYFLKCKGTRIKPVPSLLTSAGSMRCVFHAAVEIECLIPEHVALLADWPELPVVGENWLGVVCHTPMGWVLHAFAQCEWHDGWRQKAFCPLWPREPGGRDHFYLALRPSDS